MWNARNGQNWLHDATNWVTKCNFVYEIHWMCQTRDAAVKKNNLQICQIKEEYSTHMPDTNFKGGNL